MNVTYMNGAGNDFTRVWIPKAELYRFLISDIYNNIPAKSKEHLEDIQLIYKAIHNNRV